MIALVIILCVIGALLGLLAIPVVADFSYADGVRLQARWLFLRFPLIPPGEKKPKKKKKEKTAKEKKEKEEDKKEEPAKPKEPGIFARFYKYRGIPGFLDLLRRTVDALQKFGRGLWRSFCVRKLHLCIVLPGGDDPAALAEKYGKLNAAIYPPLGWLMTHLRARKGAARVQIHPDFTGLAHKQIECAAQVSVSPLLLIGALLGLVIRLGLRVALKFWREAKPPKQAQITAKN